MCKFFSAISNGKGKVLFFKLEDITKIQKEGNPNNYDWNSHTSIAHYFGIKGKREDNWNKWEYDCEKKELKIDSLNVKDDSESVKKVVEKYLADNNAIYIQKVYKNNSGYCNSGNMNSGNSNSGYWNSGNRNSGDRNSGDWNSGDWNSGYCNSDMPKIRIFNKQTNKSLQKINFPNYFYFKTNIWISQDKMTEEEKKKYWWYRTTQGYLRKIGYKEAWIKSFENASVADVKKTLKLPNFNYKIFEQISGITKKMIKNKIGE